MTAPRRRPVLNAPLGPEGRKRLADKIAGIHERGEAARAKLAEKTGKPAGRADIGRIAREANKPDALEKQIAKAEKNAVHLANLGNRADAARAERTAAELRGKLTRRQRGEALQRERETGRASRLDRFALLVKRSDVLTQEHYLIADRWLAALDAAADGEMARPVSPEAPLPEDAEGALPPPSGPAIFLSGPSVLDRWNKAVPVEAVTSGRRRVPLTFDPKRVKVVRRAPVQGPVQGVQAVAHERRDRASRLMELFVSGISTAGHPGWCVPVAIRVILKNECMTDAFVALGVTYGERNRIQAQTAMAAGLEALAPAVNKSGA
ncbi:MAG: hypothetical protein C0421_05750 [Hyphomonas sp.]|uniref:hypothetical protein n=1 Tax=Hyphomonas sp. TaxID=87 RepID=UPI0025BC8927|nr:hypothetical protein [Hyphomonas sp.]MBA4338330.1 hypothetical protein [Hyphomonas sp.]